MDWANERYVRAYVRDTADYQVLSWQARGLWWELLRKADRSGLITTQHAARGIAALVRWPLDVTASALAELVEDGCIRECEDPPGYVIPNYLPANETPQSDKQRKQESRAHRREAANKSVTKRDYEVTKRDQNVTRGHAESRDVTPSLPDRPDLPSLSKPRDGDEGPVGPDSRASRKGPKAKGYSAAELEAVSVVLGKLSDRSGVAYRGGAEHTAMIVARLRDGVTVWDMRRVIAYCAERLGWEDKPEMRTYLRPETLFGPKTIAKYLEPARSWMPEPDPGAAIPRPAEMNAPPGKPEAMALKPAQPSLVLVKPEPDPLDFSGPEWEEPPWMTQSVK